MSSSFLMPTRIIIILLSFLLSFLKPAACVYSEETDRFRFIIMGCMHFGVFDPSDYELLSEKAKEYHPDFITVLCDTIDTMDEQPMEVSWQEFHSVLAKLGIPLYDISNKNQLSFEYKNCFFIVPDSELPGSLKEALGGTFRYRHIFIFSRRYPWFEERNEWGKIIPSLSKSKVKYIFGPNLQHLELKKSGNNHIISRSLPCYLKRRPESGLLHFLVVDIDKNNASVEFVPLEKQNGLFGASHSQRKSLINIHLLSKQRAHPLTPASQQRIIETLEIRPGMNILDIGAGTGLFTFRFAEALKGTGMVFSTDVNPGMIEYIKKKMGESRYKNIFPVLVKSEGLDPFYKQNVFDIIFLSGVYRMLQHPDDYFSQLRTSLEKEKGRLYIMLINFAPDFTEIDFGDFKRIARVLASQGEEFPVFKRLREENREFVKNWKGEDVSAGIRKNILQDLNEMFLDRWLLRDLMEYYSREEIIVGKDGHAHPEDFSVLSDIKRLKWNIVDLKSFPGIDEIQLVRLRMVNKLLLIRIFEVNKLPGLENEITSHSRIEISSIVSTMEASGYQFIREYSFPEYYCLEFKRGF